MESRDAGGRGCVGGVSSQAVGVTCSCSCLKPHRTLLPFLQAAAGRATRPELAEVAAVLPALAGAFPPEGPAITAVLEAIRVRVR